MGKDTSRVRVMKDDNSVYLEVDGHEVKISPTDARTIAEAMFKTACDVSTSIQNAS